MKQRDFVALQDFARRSTARPINQRFLERARESAREALDYIRDLEARLSRGRASQSRKSQG